MSRLDDLKIEDLKEPLDAIAQAIGIESVKNLMSMCSEERIQFSTSAAVRAIRDRQIKQEFNGNNLSSLAKKHGLSVRQIRRILKIKKS